MTDTWFTADTHFGHANIIKYCNRPFASAREMDEALIERWNSRVQPNDTVWHLGDFGFYKTRDELKSVFDRLNGNKYLITGNHDRDRTKSLFWEQVVPLQELQFGSTTLVLCHYGMRVWNKSHHGALHFYGHNHGTLHGDSQSTDVGVDCWDYYPVNLEMVHERLKLWPKRPKEF